MIRNITLVAVYSFKTGNANQKNIHENMRSEWRIFDITNKTKGRQSNETISHTSREYQISNVKKETFNNN